MQSWPRVLSGSGVLKDTLDKVVTSFFAGSIRFDGGSAACRGPGVGASSWLRLLKILKTAVLPSI
jgi:hypothetical protein